MTAAVAAAATEQAGRIADLSRQFTDATGAEPWSGLSRSKPARQIEILQADLAVAHQRLQEMNWDRSLRQLATAWPLLDFDHLDATTRSWVQANVAIAQDAQGAAGQIAAKYLDQARRLEVGSLAHGDDRLDQLGADLGGEITQLQLADHAHDIVAADHAAEHLGHALLG